MKEKPILSPKVDVVFHMLFGEQKHEKITKKLIEDLIGEKVESIKLEETPYLWGEQVDDKVGIIDVKAITNNGDTIDIEMQMNYQKNVEKRILYYWSKLYNKQLKEGEKYTELKRCISILFLNYEITRLKELPIHTKWQILESEKKKTVLTKDLEIHIIEIPKIVKKVEAGELKKWILFLENPEGEETKKMAEESKELKEAIETLEDISSDEQKRRVAELREKYVRDKAEELESAEALGVEKGIKQGVQQKTIEIAKNMLHEKMPIELIIKITGLTEEEIIKLKF